MLKGDLGDGTDSLTAPPWHIEKEFAKMDSLLLSKRVHK